MILKNVKFIKSAFTADALYKSGLRQIAVAGRSNAGKSSFINFLCNDGGMAKVSKEAGKTRSVNYFSADEKFILTDLPGYGFSKVSKSEKYAWGALLETYLKTEPNLIRVLLLLDIRHAPSSDDLLMQDFMVKLNIPFSVIATKSDKIPRSQTVNRLTALAASLKIGRDDIIPVSALKRAGEEKVRALFGRILEERSGV